MPTKGKTHKAATKRLKLTARGKVRRNRMGHDHLMTSKNAKRRRRLRSSVIIEGAQAKKLTGFLTRS